MGIYVVTGIDSGILNILRLFEKEEMAQQYIATEASKLDLPLDENGEVHDGDWDIGTSVVETVLDYGPRPPRFHETFDLESWIVSEYGKSKEEAKDLVSAASIAVFDHYMTDSPGYAGPVMVVVWPSGPELHEVFYWPRAFYHALPE